MNLPRPRVFKSDFPHIFKQKWRFAVPLNEYSYIFTRNNMKAVCYIMAIVIAGLSAYPCNDADICVDDQKFSYSILEANDHNHSSSELDLCTPFCTCSCCCAHIHLPTTFTYNLTNADSSSPAISHSSVFVDMLSYSIWQPPKLA